MIVSCRLYERSMDETPEQIEQARKAKLVIYIVMAVFIVAPIAIFLLRMGD
jgi:hypothetical protein